MNEPLYTTRSRVWKVEGVHRRARLEVGSEVDFGVHGPIREHFSIPAGKDLPLPVDYIAASTGA